MTSGIEKIERKFVLLGPVEPVMLGHRDKMCCLPYPKHPRGCPKFGKCQACPPKAQRFSELYSPESIQIAVVIFDFAAYLRLRREQHPDWTERAIRNPRHWQGHLAAELRRRVSEMSLGSGERPDFNPEAIGVDVTDTCARAGLDLEWPPVNKVCRVAIIAETL